ncbi:MAG: Gfo/Idh/MocA family oxidoreductase [Bacteroidales bacterium]|nr:MAG: Gfo/Idh/MocA family oxidoreductase [Bacteroidales bacterium]
MKTNYQGSHYCTRRSFIKRSSSVVAGLSIVPRYVLGGRNFIPPSDKITVACIGVGSQGTRVMLDFLRQPEVQVVSVCDVNKGSEDFIEWGKHEIRNKVRELLRDDSWGRNLTGALAGMNPAQEIVNRFYAMQKDLSGYEGCSAWTDYRELLEKGKDVDAIIVGTPDHLHTAISVKAMTMGKHVYCQKPMTHTVYEARRMAEVAEETKTATQVATGNSASEATRLLCEWIWSNAIGPVRDVYNWSTRPFWPQGIERPHVDEEIPAHLNWNLWLGPAPYRTYHSVYQPFVWRGWYDFGTGAIGDMGCYSFDTLFRVLKLRAPARVDVSSTTRFEETYPAAAILHFHFPAREEMPPVTVHWYDGGLKPEKPEELGDLEFDDEGLLLVGDRGKILCGFSGGRPHLIPEKAMETFVQPPKTLPRSAGHNEEWIAACKGGEPAGANFMFAGPVTETILLGNVALRTGKTITWDSKNFTVTNDKAANDLLHMPYRNGWTL